jgi:hypothetical protein
MEIIGLELAFTGSPSSPERPVAKAGKLVSLRSGVKRRNLQHSNQAVLFFSPDFDRSLHPFAGQELLSSRSSFILEPLWKSMTWDEDGLARQEPGSNLP